MKAIFTIISCLLVASNVFIASANAESSEKEKTITISYTSNMENEFQGEWNIISLKNKDISTRERAFLSFNFKDSVFYGNNGCNVINGSIHTSGSNGMQFSNIISTMMECHNATSERSIMKALNETASYKLSEKDGIRYLTLMNEKGHQLMYLKNKNINFLNGAWTVSSINGDNVTSKNVRIVIDIQEMKIHGNSGCNIINGTLYIDPDKDWGVEFQQLISTRKMCPDIQIETALLVALEETQICKKINSDEIALFDGEGKELATLKRLNLKQ